MSVKVDSARQGFCNYSGKCYAKSYAGDSIAKGAVVTPIGYSHLYDVQRDQQPPSQFTIDWQAAPGYRNVKENDSIHIRLHALTPCNDIALANGDPPQNKPGNPKTLRYVLTHRSGENLQSTFVNVIEPYSKKPFIKSVQLLNGVAVQVTKTDGSIDYLLFNSATLPNGIAFKGAIGLIQQKANTIKGVLINGSQLKYKQLKLTNATPYTGTIKKMNRELQGGGWVLVDTQLPVELEGEQLILKKNSYTIQRITREGKFTKIYCGPITFIRDYNSEKIAVRGAKVPKDYKTGYLYDFEEGDPFIITNHTVKNK